MKKTLTLRTKSGRKLTIQSGKKSTKRVWPKKLPKVKNLT